MVLLASSIPISNIFCESQRHQAAECLSWDCQDISNLFQYVIQFNKYKTISDGGITVDFSIIKVHTSNWSSNTWGSSNSWGSSNTWGSSNSWDHRIVGDHHLLPEMAFFGPNILIFSTGSKSYARATHLSENHLVFSFALFFGRAWH